MGKIRIALTISGAVSLGAFEGGALAALITGLQATQRLNRDPKDPDLRIDAIGGSSAGAITAVLAARAITAGLDPIDALQGAWVSEVSLRLLLKRSGLRAPLTMEGLREKALDLLQPARPPADIQEAPVRVQLSLCNLRGLAYDLHRLDDADQRRRQPGDVRRPVSVLSHVDMWPFTVKPRADVTALLEPAGRSPVDYALSSGANEFGFPPRLLTLDARRYRDNGVTNFPPGGTAWFTDGGTLENEPLGRTLDLANALDDGDSDDDGNQFEPIGDGRRVHILIHPFPDRVAVATREDRTAWADPGRRPGWLPTLARAFGIIRAQSLYADFNRAEKVNSRIAWQRRLHETLDPLVNALHGADQERWRAALTRVLRDIDADRDRLRRRPRPPQAAPERPPAVADLLRQVIQRVTGLADKHAVAIDVVTPYLAEHTDGRPLEDLLAGEAFLAFGGFFEQGLRRSDFALGYVCMLNWMSTGLAGYGLDAAQVDAALDASLVGLARLRWRKGGTEKGFGKYGLRPALLARPAASRLDAESWRLDDFTRASGQELLVRHPMLSARLAGHVLRVAGRDTAVALAGTAVHIARALLQRDEKRPAPAGR